jgi:hypothetical protein
MRKNLATLAGMRPLTSVPDLGPLRLRRWRRVLVGVLGIGWALAAAMLLAPGVPTALAIAAVVATLLVWVALVLVTRNLTQTVDAFADERERVVRDRAHRLAYWALAPVLGGVIGWLLTYAMRSSRQLILGPAVAPQIAAVCWTLFVLYGALPVAILAWTEPDPPEHEFDD